MLTDENILTLLIAGSIFVGTLFVAGLWRSTATIDRRITSLKDKRSGVSHRQRSSLGNGDASASSATFHDMLKRLNLTSREVQQPIRQKLQGAGLRGKNAVEIFLFFKLVSPFVIGATAYLMLAGGLFGELQFQLIMVFCVVALLIGYMAPEIYVSNLRSKRGTNIQRALPDALDLLVICAEAGLSLDVALNRVAKEITPTGPELADELSMTSIELNFLPDRRTAFSNLTDRVSIKELRSVVNTLAQTEKYGTPLSQSLRVLSEEFRHERMLKAEEKAARLPALMTMPLMVFILPTLFIVLVGPAIIDVSDQLSVFN